MPLELDNADPVDPLTPESLPWSEKLQGNIINGHGRDHTANIFITLPGNVDGAKALVSRLAAGVTSAAKQETERRRFKTLKVPGETFRMLLISATGYRKLGFDEDRLSAAFDDAAQPQVQASFLGGARGAVDALQDPPPAEWEEPFRESDLDLLLIVADDDEQFLLRRCGEVLTSLPDGTLAHVERGEALRTAGGEGIEHFGYVDGRSQPLYTTWDFERDASGNPIRRDGNLVEAGGGGTKEFPPFASLGLVLVPDVLADDAEAFGSYFVFRKLEQNVRGFKLAEQALADALKLPQGERERAGAMAVGRFEDGTPVVVSRADGFIPAKENNFNYGGDGAGLKCPFQAHIRKTNPRGEAPKIDGIPPERDRRITRRGITYGDRPEHPQAAQDISALPSEGVGLLFMCFQSSIPKQFGFMQRFWANSENFLKDGVGLDPLIGQFKPDNQANPPRKAPIKQRWRAEWGGEVKDKAPLRDTHETEFLMNGFVTMKGGEFFFAPSIPFLQSLQAASRSSAREPVAQSEET
ncbi:Dyp-type peroxidase [Propylenella binzhouense]|uniref:Peroxidase n=1 Tax=Propylenella binzhouense TaxID=2555902 RepID=A0A964T4U8_9HYPH|nr:peroxidase [Propylenella binzhouense]MYZ48384.1 peroxidase [Propylenella binzhouense]